MAELVDLETLEELMKVTNTIIIMILNSKTRKSQIQGKMIVIQKEVHQDTDLKDQGQDHQRARKRSHISISIAKTAIRRKGVLVLEPVLKRVIILKGEERMKRRKKKKLLILSRNKKRL